MKKQLALLLSALLITSSGTGFAAWTGSPVSGVGGITASSATSVEVTVGDASNPRLEMTWNAFTCDSGQTVTFRQGAGASSYFSVLNRLNTGAVTNFAGTIQTADSGGTLSKIGQVFFVNPYGFNINNGAQINCGAVTLSTMDLPAAERTHFGDNQYKAITFTNSGSPLVPGAQGILVYAGSAINCENNVILLSDNALNLCGDAGTRTITASTTAVTPSGTILLAQVGGISLVPANSNPVNQRWFNITPCDTSAVAYFTSSPTDSVTLRSSGVYALSDNSNAANYMAVGTWSTQSMDNRMNVNSYYVYKGNSANTVKVHNINNCTDGATAGGMSSFSYYGNVANLSPADNPPITNVDFDGTITQKTGASTTSFYYGEIYNGSVGGTTTIDETAYDSHQTLANTFFGTFPVGAAAPALRVFCKAGDLVQSAAFDAYPNGRQLLVYAGGTDARVIFMDKANLISNLTIYGADGGAGLFNNRDLSLSNAYLTHVIPAGSPPPATLPGLYLTSTGNISQPANGVLYTPYLYAVSGKSGGTISMSGNYNSVNDNYDPLTPGPVSGSFDAYFCNDGSHTLSFNNNGTAELDLLRVKNTSTSLSVTSNTALNIGDQTLAAGITINGGINLTSNNYLVNNVTRFGGISTNGTLTAAGGGNITLVADSLRVGHAITSASGRLTYDRSSFDAQPVSANSGVNWNGGSLVSNAVAGYAKAAVVIKLGTDGAFRDSGGYGGVISTNYDHASLAATPYAAIYGGTYLSPLYGSSWTNISMSVAQFTADIETNLAAVKTTHSLLDINNLWATPF